MIHLLKKIFLGKTPQIFKVKSGIACHLYIKLNPLNEATKIFGFYEIEIQKYFKQYAMKCNVFFDIGSYDGYYSLIYRKFNSDGEIYLCEASNQAYIFQQQIENFAHNSFSMNRVQVIKYFISDKDKDTSRTINSLYKNINTSIFFKIDVEGAEIDVLKGGIEVFNQNNCYFIIETHSENLEKECIAFLKKINYQTKIIKNSRLSIMKGRLL